MALGALLIQTQYRFPDEEIPLQIQETPCLQYFCGLPRYKDELPFDPSLMVYFRKRLTPEILGEINEMIIAKSVGEIPPNHDDEPPSDSQNSIVEYLSNGKVLSEKDEYRFDMIGGLFDQQQFMHVNRTHQVADRIVSLSQPWVRQIVRGKAKAKCEFGAKLDISVSGGFTRLEHTSFEAYNESENLIDIIKRYKNRTGHYPARVLADKIYRTRENIKFCKSNGIEILGKPLGRPPKESYSVNRREIRQAEIDRIEVERKFSQAKGSHGLGLIKTRLKDTSLTAIAVSILSLNIAHAVRVLCLILMLLMVRKRAVVQ
jgi:hypothetical protein